MCDMSKDFILLSKIELISPGWRSIARLTFKAILKRVFQTKNFYVCGCDTVGWISAWFCHSAVLNKNFPGKQFYLFYCILK